MGILNIDAYPARWPEGWDRTPSHRRQRSKYQTSFARARDEIVRQLKLLGAREIVVSTNVPLRRDGLPLAGMSEPADPTVAVYWAEASGWDAARQQTAYRHRVIACDHWQRVWENMHAINKSVDALRAIKRAGTTQIVDRVFMGFAALAASNDTSKPWRDVFGWNPDWPVTRAYVDQIFRALARERHPDVGGGSESAMRELTVAHQAALKELG